MKKSFLLAAVFAALVLPVRAADSAAFGEEERQAFEQAFLDVSAAIRGSAIPDKASVSVLPISGDRGDAIAGLVKIAVTDAGKTYVEGHKDPMWVEVIREMAFDERNTGLLDEKTLVKIGSLKATDVLVYGVVRACTKTENRIFVEIELHATDVKTKTHLWGGLFAKRWYVPGTDIPKGISELSLPIRSQLKRRTTKMLVESLAAQPKLSKIRSVVLTPLAGDEDRYCTYIVRDGLVATDLKAKELDLASLQGARTTFRDLPVVAGDAVIYGAVRQLGYKKFPGWKDFWTLYKVDLDFQAAIERNDNHDVLWSDTIQSYVHLYDLNWGKILLFGIPALLVLFAFFAFLRKTSRVR